MPEQMQQIEQMLQQAADVTRHHWAIDLAYLVAAVLFILGIKGLTHPRTAVRGNMMSALGMLIAIVATAFAIELHWALAICGMLIGGVIGAVWSYRVPMTAMPQMVAILNGFGGGASVFVAWAGLIMPSQWTFITPFGDPVNETLRNYQSMPADALIASALAIFIGAITLIGSALAFAKLQEIKQFRKPIGLPGHQALNAVMIALSILLIVWQVSADDPGIWPMLLLTVVAAVLGFTLVSPIGGADMPVVIALLNSYSGLAAAATGFIISNTVLIITGSLVGASGIILTAIMCKAMNRSIINVLFGKIDASAATSGDEVYEGRIRATTADEIAMTLDGAQRVVIVPGYGMAVAQAQSAVADLYELLQSKGTKVEFAIHPVAGRMPGHMNVLLAEVNIPYEKLVEMDQINPEFSQVDVVIVIGANDVVNPDARAANSPIAGMPILDVDKARTVIVVKRSLSPGFAGIPNPLFAADNTLMYFADGKKAVMDIIAAVKSG